MYNRFTYDAVVTFLSVISCSPVLSLNFLKFLIRVNITCWLIIENQVYSLEAYGYIEYGITLLSYSILSQEIAGMNASEMTWSTSRGT